MHIRDARQIGKVENALMRLAVASHQSRPVDCKNDRKILKTDIMENLVVGSLQEGRIHGNNRLQTARRKSRRKGDSVLLRNPDIEKSVRVHIVKSFQPCTVRHRRRDCHDLPVPLPELAHDRRKDIRIIRH